MSRAAPPSYTWRLLTHASTRRRSLVSLLDHKSESHHPYQLHAAGVDFFQTPSRKPNRLVASSSPVIGIFVPHACRTAYRFTSWGTAKPIGTSTFDHLLITRAGTLIRFLTLTFLSEDSLQPYNRTFGVRHYKYRKDTKSPPLTRAFAYRVARTGVRAATCPAACVGLIRVASPEPHTRTTPTKQARKTITKN